MTSRERVRKAINHEEPDRVPIDIGGTKVTGIHMDEYIELGRHLGIDVEPPKVYEQFVMLARMDETVRQRLHADVLEIENPVETWGYHNSGWKAWVDGKANAVLVPGAFTVEKDEETKYSFIMDGEGNILAHMPPDGLYFERYCSTQLSDEIHKIDPEEWKKTLPLYADEDLRAMERAAKFYYENTEYSLHGGFLKGKMGSSGMFAGLNISDWMTLLILDPDYTSSILRASAERAIENLEMYLQAVGKYIDTIFVCGTDFGSQRSEMISPAVFEKIHAPNMKLMNDCVHRNSNAKTLYHSCGSIRNLIPHYIAAGVDIINPVQAEAAGMDPIQLKEDFGDEIVFWGGAVDPQSVFPNGSPRQVREQVKERIGALAKGGGYVCASIHNIQYEVPPGNILAFADAAFEYGRYPIQ